VYLLGIADTLAGVFFYINLSIQNLLQLL